MLEQSTMVARRRHERTKRGHTALRLYMQSACASSLIILYIHSATCIPSLLRAHLAIEVGEEVAERDLLPRIRGRRCVLLDLSYHAVHRVVHDLHVVAILRGAQHMQWLVTSVRSSAAAGGRSEDGVWGSGTRRHCSLSLRGALLPRATWHGLDARSGSGAGLCACGLPVVCQPRLDGRARHRGAGCCARCCGSEGRGKAGRCRDHAHVHAGRRVLCAEGLRVRAC